MKTQTETWKDREGHEWPVIVKREDRQPKLVTFGRGRTVIYYSAHCHCAGYDDPEDFFAPSRWWTHDHAERKDPAQFEGVPFIDLRHAAASQAGYHMAVSGPMINVDLLEGEVDRLGEPDQIFTSAMTDTAFGGLLTLQKVARIQARRAGPLDGVSTVEFCRLWRDAGAIVGIIRNGQFCAE